MLVIAVISFLGPFGGASPIEKDTQPEPQVVHPQKVVEAASSPEEFARLQVDKVRSAIIEKLEIDVSDLAVQQYFKQEAAEPILSKETYEQQRLDAETLADALETLLNGEDPDKVYELSGYKLAGLDKDHWGSYVSLTDTVKRNMIVTMRQRSMMTYHDFVNELVPQLSPIYVQRVMSQRICNLPEVKKKIDAHFKSATVTGSVEATPSKGLVHFQCHKSARLWVLDFAKRLIGPVDSSLEGWEKQIPLFSKWDN